MARDEAPPFERGVTAYNGDTIDTNDLVGTNWEGKEWVFEDVNPTTGVPRTNRKVRCRCVRNAAAIALLPKRVVSFQATAGNYGMRVDGYATTTGARGYPLDEYLPTAGVPINDLAWIVVDGPAVILKGLANTSLDIAIGDRVAALTAATSGATTAGRISTELEVALGAATSGVTLIDDLLDRARNFIGRALSLVVTNSTDSDVLVEVGKW